MSGGSEDHQGDQYGWNREKGQGSQGDKGLEGSLGPGAEGLLGYAEQLGLHLRLFRWLSGRESPAMWETLADGKLQPCREDPLRRRWHPLQY